MAKAEYEFTYVVHPQLCALSKVQANELVRDKIIVPVIEECRSTVFTINHSTAMGMIYWLAEQCFVRWHTVIQLSYQAAFDPFHAMYRNLRILEAIDRSKALFADHIRLLDFYLLLSFKISSIRMAPQHRKFRAVAAEYEDQSGCIRRSAGQFANLCAYEADANRGFGNCGEKAHH